MFLLALIKFLISIYDLISFPFHYLIEKPWIINEHRNKIKAKQVDEDIRSPWIRISEPISIEAEKSLAVNNQCQNINELFEEATEFYSNKKCLGIRPVLEGKYENGVLTKVVLSDDYEWITYRDARIKVNNYSKGFRCCGIEKGDKVIMYAETSKEWFLACQSLFKIGSIMATLYTSLGPDEVTHGIQETEAQYVITDKKMLDNLLTIIPKIQNVKHIIVLDNHEVKEVNNNFNIISLKEIELMGIQSNNDNIQHDFPIITLDDIAFIMYTSGSTGKPKGVMLTHRNILSAIKGVTIHLYSILKKEDNINIAYLPLAHILEFTGELLFFANGIPIGYSSINTLTDKSPGILPGQKGDSSLLKPTIFIAVPLVLERIKKAIQDEIEKRGEFFQKFFQFAIEYKYKWSLKGFSTPILDDLLFNKIKRILGNRIRLIPCGGAPLSAETQKFFNVCFGINILQGYGLTETSGITFLDVDESTLGIVGEPLPFTQVKLVDWPEGGYRITDKPRPRGEIMAKGDHIAKGYFRADHLTKEAFIQESDGSIWFITGDIGEMLDGGKLKIIDRKKDIVKMQHGEFVSLGKVESALIKSVYINNICVYCNPLKSKPIALINPNEFELKKLAETLHLDNGMSWKSICQNEQVKQIVKESILEAAAAGCLKRFEIPSKFQICHEEWAINNGMLTPSMKIARRTIYSFYKNQIDEMCNQLN